MKKYFIFIGCLLGLFILHTTSNAQTTIVNDVPGNLKHLLNEEQQDTCSFLKIIGEINGEDLILLRRMAGYITENDTNFDGNLQTLDLRYAKIVTGEEPFMILDDKNDGIMLRPKLQAPTVETAIPKNTWYYAPGTQRFTAFNDWRFSIPTYIIGNDPDENAPNSLMSNRTSQKAMKKFRREGLFKLKAGNEIEWTGNGYKLHINTHKNRFPLCAFYECTHLEKIFLSHDTKINEQVRIYNDDIQYYICKENKIKSVILDGRKYKCADNVSDAMKRGNTLTKIKIKK